MIVRVPPAVADYAEEAAKLEFLKPSEVVRAIMRQGMLEHQAERRRRQEQRVVPLDEPEASYRDARALIEGSRK
jgi:hypothetical protein